ncbi:hypothetical protein LMG24238_07280 [Paraburkholderia sediminicola]|uniref:Uncharacterized protein n=1 Tax=Paraburkholderia sediminicola TaxID=458836 RepID=A0A6J5CVB6_9BURK|nr:hypothetical protein LMG24238_07280 [Paraburkholderia sediminicola]
MSFMASSVTDNYHEFFLQFTCQTDGSWRIFLEAIGATASHWMRHRSESISREPFAVTVYKKLSRALYVLLPGRFINLPNRKPRHMRQIMMHQMIVVVEDQLNIAHSLAAWDLMAHC